MSGFEFIFGLFSVILSLAITEVLACAARLIRHAERVRFSLAQALWMAVFLLIAVGNWLSLWQLRHVSDWQIAQLLSAIAVPATQFVACALVCPDTPDAGPIDMAAFHDRERRRYLAAFIGLIVICAISNTFFAKMEGVEQWARDNLLIVPLLLGALLALATRNPWAQRLGLAVVIVATVVFLGTLQVSLA